MRISFRYIWNRRKKLASKIRIPGRYGNLGHRIEELQRDLYSVRQVVNLIASRQRTGKNIKVVFLVHNTSAWDSTADVLAAMQQADDFTPIVASINRKFPGDETFGFEPATHAWLEKMGVPHLRLGMENSFEALDILKTIGPDIIFRQSQWDPDFPPAFNTAELRFAKLCYIPYEIFSLVVPPAEGFALTHDSLYQRACWRVFCATETDVICFQKTAARQSSNVVCTGHPKVERLMKKSASGSSAWPIENSPGRIKVLWTAHHSTGNHWSNFGLFPVICEEMLAWAASSPDISIVFSPHPACLATTVSLGYLSESQLNRFLAQWNALPNTAIIMEGDYAEVMAASDCLICDGISFLLEYQLFSKPVIFLERKAHAAFTEDGQRVIEGTHRVGTLNEAKALVARFRNGEPDPLRQKQIDNAQWLGAYGNAAQNILGAIRKGMDE